MTHVTKILWLLLPALVVATAWAVTERVASSSAKTDLWIVAGVLLIALLIGYVVTSRDDRDEPTSRRSDRSSHATVVRVVQSVQLPGREWLHAVQFDSNTILVGSSGGRLTRLDNAPAVQGHPNDAGQREPTDEGADLSDTPRDLQELSDEPRTLEKALASRSVRRAALSEASLATFKEKVAATRAGS